MGARTDLDLVIDSLELVDTHEHLIAEDQWPSSDILRDLFFGYPAADLAVAGAGADAIERLLDPTAGDIEPRFAGVHAAWEAMRHTGYGESVRLTAREVYGLDSLTPEGLRADARRVSVHR